MAFTSDQLNFLIYRYLQESGFQTTATSFAQEALILKRHLLGHSISSSPQPLSSPPQITVAIGVAGSRSSNKNNEESNGDNGDDGQGHGNMIKVENHDLVEDMTISNVDKMSPLSPSPPSISARPSEKDQPQKVEQGLVPTDPQHDIVDAPVGRLISLVQKGLQFIELELHTKEDGSFSTCKRPISILDVHECDPISTLGVKMDAREDNMVTTPTLASAGVGRVSKSRAKKAGSSPTKEKKDKEKEKDRDKGADVDYQEDPVSAVSTGRRKTNDKHIAKKVKKDPEIFPEEEEEEFSREAGEILPSDMES